MCKQPQCRRFEPYTGRQHLNGPCCLGSERRSIQTANMDSGVLNYHRRSNCNPPYPIRYCTESDMWLSGKRYIRKQSKHSRIWGVSQAAKTWPCHGSGAGSIPVRIAICSGRIKVSSQAFQACNVGFESHPECHI